MPPAQAYPHRGSLEASLLQLEDAVASAAHPAAAGWWRAQTHDAAHVPAARSNPHGLNAAARSALECPTCHRAGGGGGWFPVRKKPGEQQQEGQEQQDETDDNGHTIHVHDLSEPDEEDQLAEGRAGHVRRSQPGGG